MKPYIICVDDDRPVLNAVVADVRSRFGRDYEIEPCESGEEALELIKKLIASGDHVALCISDERMPGMKGVKLLEELFRLAPDAIRVLLTAYADTQVAIDAINKARVDRYIQKPWDPIDFFATCSDLLESYRKRASLASALASGPGNHIFMTGATGFLGPRFVRQLLDKSACEITLLTRSTETTPYYARLPFRSEDYPGRLHFVEGDVSEPGLGIEPGQLSALRNTINEVWHFAASTNFNEKYRAATFAANIDGTKNVLQFCHSLPILTRFYHISTCYVSGSITHPSVFGEGHKFPGGFKNVYEESKYYAEAQVVSSGLPYVVLRPSIVIGESFSGRSDDKTMYAAAKAFYYAKQLYLRMLEEEGKLPAVDDKGRFVIPIRTVGDLSVRKNVIPIDLLVDMMLRLRQQPGIEQQIFNLANPTPTTWHILLAGIAHALNMTIPDCKPDLDLEGLASHERLLFKSLGDLRVYTLVSDPVFDMTNTMRVLGDYDIRVADQGFINFCFKSFFEQWEKEFPPLRPRDDKSQKAAAS